MTVLPFPERTCFGCAHLTEHNGSYCLLFGDPIVDERDAARDCEEYLPYGVQRDG